MALAIADRYQYSYFDSLIIASALEITALQKIGFSVARI
jgi:predicted nucleic acid-binding protein